MLSRDTCGVDRAPQDTREGGSFTSPCILRGLSALRVHLPGVHLEDYWRKANIQMAPCSGAERHTQHKSKLERLVQWAIVHRHCVSLCYPKTGIREFLVKTLKRFKSTTPLILFKAEMVYHHLPGITLPPRDAEDRSGDGAVSPDFWRMDSCFLISSRVEWSSGHVARTP